MLWQDVEGFAQSIAQFLEVATAVRAVRESGSFHPEELASKVEAYCASQMRYVETRHSAGADNNTVCYSVRNEHNLVQGRGNVLLMLLPEGSHVRELVSGSTEAATGTDS